MWQGNAFANALSPSFKTPTFATFSPLSPTGPAPTAGRDVEAAINTHEHLSQATIPDSQPSDPNLPQDFGSFDLSGFGTGDGRPQDELKASIDTTVSSAGSIQTPPPTSTSASRRKAQQAQTARLGKDQASHNGRRMSSPATAQHDPHLPHNTLTEDSPLQFPNLQFSPDGFSFPVSGPATAPVYPQHKLFWDPEQSSGIMNVDMSMDETFSAFGITSQRFPDSFIDENINPFTTSQSSHTLQQTTGISQASRTSALNQTNISSSTAISKQGSSSAKDRRTDVNPSDLFSSPSRVPNFPDMNVFQAQQDDSMQPYAQQLKDAQLEKEMKARKQKRKRPPELGESPAVTMATAALRDDSTNSSKSSPVIADSYFGALPEGPPQLPNRKRMTPDNHYQKHGGQSSLSRRRSSKRSSKQPAVTLKIDESGRAVTETSFAKDVQSSKMETDSDSGSSDDSSDTENVFRDQHDLSKWSKPDQVRRARFADDPYSHSQRSSDASTLVSGKSRPQGRLSMNAGHAHVHFPPSQDDDSEVSTIIDSDEDRGDAQSELKKLVRQRVSDKKTSKRTSVSLSKQTKSDRRLSFAPGTSQATKAGIAAYYNTHQATYSSPTTMTDPDLATPSTSSKSNRSGDSTRCVCGTADGAEGLMIQWFV